MNATGNHPGAWGGVTVKRWHCLLCASGVL